MNTTDVNHLIDAIVRQTMVLIATLATAGGRRAPLAHVANQVFIGLVDELQNQGVTAKITADMFGMALRTYQRKRQRLMESATDSGRSLWEAVLTFIGRQDGLVSRADVLIRFRRDDEMTVRGVLNDLVETGLVFKTGHGDATCYRSTTPEERGETAAAAEIDSAEVRATLTWIAVYRNGPATHEEIAAALSMDEDLVSEALETLVVDGRVRETEDDDGALHYECDAYLIPYGSDSGWAAAVFDHYQALVAAICAKVQTAGSTSQRSDSIGGSTYNFDVWDGHPYDEEVLNLLAELRERCHKLRNRIDAYNASVVYEGPKKRSVFYLGQNILADEEDR